MAKRTQKSKQQRKTIRVLSRKVEELTRRIKELSNG
jgi:cell division protein FtsB